MGDLPLRDPEVYRLARELDRLRRQIHDVQVASQGAHRSVEDGAIDVYDDNDVLRERIGKQTDGTYGRKSFAGDPPPAPTDPDVQVIGDGVVAVTWDGRFEEKYLTGEFRAVQVHLGDDPAFVCSRNTMEGALFTRWGGTVVVVTESDDDNPVYVKLRAINRAGVVGAESAGVLVDEEDDLDLEDDEEHEWEANDAYTLTASDVTAGTATVQLSHLPEVESVRAVWGVLPQEPTEYTVDYETGVVTWPLDGFEKEGDRIWFHYTHRTFAPPPPWWLGDPTLGNPNGYPLAAEVGWRVTNQTEDQYGLSLVARFDWHYDVEEVAFALASTYQWVDSASGGGQPMQTVQGTNITINTYGTLTGHAADTGAGIEATWRRQIPFVNNNGEWMAEVLSGTRTNDCSKEAFAAWAADVPNHLKIDGLTISTRQQENSRYQGYWLPQEYDYQGAPALKYPWLGVTNPTATREAFYLGTQIADYAHPTDPEGVADPYRPLTLLGPT